MTKQLVVNADYNGIAMTFTGDGWFNATLAAERFGKRVDNWLRLDETKEYITVLFLTLNPSEVRDLSKAEITTLIVSLLATCQPNYTSESKPLINKGFILSYAELVFKSNSAFVEELNKINVVDLVAVTGNNVKQELQNLFKSVQHHTIVGVFFCLSFSNLPIMGELRLALALVRLWWGGCRNKPFIGRILHAVDLTVLNLPAALHLGQIITTSLPVRKV